MSKSNTNGVQLPRQKDSPHRVTQRDTRQGAHAVDLVCLSHLRWDWVYQRPQHLMSRCAQRARVFFFEDPIFDTTAARLDVGQRDSGLWVATPHLPAGISEAVVEAAQRKLLDDLFELQHIDRYVLWYYTPMALGYTRHLKPELTVYDCMDELSMFKDPPPHLKSREAELFERARLVFTGGQSLYEAKRTQHPSVHAFPSSIDKAHFGRAREGGPDPVDQAGIPHPRLGFFGVVDERMDLDLLTQVADARPDWHLVIIGPVAKIDPETLPQRTNIHYLGAKSYKELPHYLAGWDAALLPFARNDSTRFISPTKTPEYLAGGRPVVSTAIRDVARPYGEQGLVWIADDTPGFVSSVEQALSLNGDRGAWLKRVDAFLAENSWDNTWAAMWALIETELNRQAASRAARRAKAKAPSTNPQTAFVRQFARES